MKTDKDWIVNGPAYAKVNNKYYCKSCGRTLSLVSTEINYINYCYHCGRYQYNINYKPITIKCNSARNKNMNWSITATIPNPTGGKE